MFFSQSTLIPYMVPKDLSLNRVMPYFSKPFGTHTFYQMRDQARPPPTQLSQKLLPHKPEIFQGIRDTIESLRNVKFVYIVYNLLP